MARGSSEAYDLSLFETQPRLRAVNSPEKTAEMQEKKERRARNGRLASNIIISVLLVAVFALMIVSRVQLTELNDQISASREELAILRSETSRLTNELSAKTSAESVDAYADEHGMEKIESHQIEYITVDGGDKIEVSDPAPDGIFETIGALIAGWFDA
ncbi:MAG: hypothetical protein E7553_01640 [Ruminococcaceae bacterium]|nr:hypothetical protein [Oscillospiraceae bacterium]